MKVGRAEQGVVISMTTEESALTGRLIRYLLENYGAVDETALNVSKDELTDLVATFAAPDGLFNAALSEKEFLNLGQVVSYIGSFHQELYQQNEPAIGALGRDLDSMLH